MKRRALASAPTASADDLANMLRLLGLADRIAVQSAHCVRCHSTYDATLNTDNACDIWHAEDAMETIDCRKRGYVYRMTISCCGLQWEGSYEDPPPAGCITASHTTDVNDVRRHHRTDETLREHGKYDRNGRIVETCAQAGCNV